MAEKENEKELSVNEKLFNEIMNSDLSKVDVIENHDQLTLEQISTITQKMVDDYTKSLEGLTLEELNAAEEVLVEKANKWDVELHNKTYKLLDKMEWKDKSITKKQIGSKIYTFLDKFECEYKYTLGMYQLAMWWANPQEEIDFSTLDATLRVLNQQGMKYKGPREWENILIVYQYFRDCNTAYDIDTLQTFMFANRHSALLDLRNLNTPVVAKGKVVEEQEESDVTMVEA